MNQNVSKPRLISDDAVQAALDELFEAEWVPITDHPHGPCVPGSEAMRAALEAALPHLIAGLGSDGEQENWDYVSEDANE